MNLAFGQECADAVKKSAMTSKFVKSSEDLTYYAVFAIKGESIVVDEELTLSTKEYPAGGADLKSITEEDYLTNVFKPLVAKIGAKYVKEGCYIVVDYFYNNKDTTTSKPIVMKYVPDTAGVRNKMLLGSSFESFKRNAGILSNAFQFSTTKELDEFNSTVRGF